MLTEHYLNPDFKRSPKGKGIKWEDSYILKSNASFSEARKALEKFDILTHGKTLHEVLAALHQRIHQYYNAHRMTKPAATFRDFRRDQECRQLLALVTHTKKLIRWLYQEDPKAMPFELTMELYKTPSPNRESSHKQF